MTNLCGLQIALEMSDNKHHRRQRILRRFTLTTLITLVVVTGCGGSWLYLFLQGSLPQLDGRIEADGLRAVVTIERDALGIPTIRGANRFDVAHASGFLHAQDRFFQMDLLRRSAAGELAALFGQAALPADRGLRLHRFRSRARDTLASLPAPRRKLLETYSNGVNAGLGALDVAPFEYLVLRARPRPWSPEDSLLVIYAMYLDLQHRTWSRESTLGVMEEVLPRSLYTFLNPHGTEWDTPLQGDTLEIPPLPGPETIDLRKRPAPLLAPASRSPTAPEFSRGSNNWAVASTHTSHGGAILANDMHLALAVPNTWYRASLIYPQSGGEERRITGVMLPGTPAMVVGSNGQVAWGFTNSEGDWSDLVILEPAAGTPGHYLTPEGPRPLQRVRETIRVKDSADNVLAIDATPWGPVFDVDHRGRRRALRWVAHDPRAVNLALLDLETATTVEAALAVANRAGIPNQNFVVADAQGHIGWTITGRIPRRFGFDGRTPKSWANGERGWDGWLTPAEYPRIVNPVLGRLWTANARVAAGAALARLGDGGYDLGARARQIRNGLLALEQAEERDMLALQLDDRARFLERWRTLLLEVLTPEAIAASPDRGPLRQQVENWGGRAAVNAVGYRIVRTFRTRVAERVFAPLLHPCRQADGRFDYNSVRLQEGPLWRLIEARPPHLLNPSYPTWQAQLLNAVDTLIGELRDSGTPLTEYIWGRVNISQIRHPLSHAIPGAGRWLDMPALALPGDSHMPRVQTPEAGASQRMVVSPGRESAGIFHMPGGQSGHPLSPHYRDGHAAWAEGKATPFLPGPMRHRLVLAPAGQR